MEKQERTILLQLQARFGGAGAARAGACARCAELLRARKGSTAFLAEVQRLAGEYCPPPPDAADLVAKATAALRAGVGRDLTPEAVAALVAAAQRIAAEPRVHGERTMLELWMRRPEVFSESLSQVLLQRWRELQREDPAGKS
ncbi:MAG TPA: hypothetical protein VEO54_26260 [Thermoanaerobaculia bacterium]|nr:hypothetical protein [Thermoanaerobaculia bacterium]